MWSLHAPTSYLSTALQNAHVMKEMGEDDANNNDEADKGICCLLLQGL